MNSFAFYVPPGRIVGMYTGDAAGAAIAATEMGAAVVPCESGLSASAYRVSEGLLVPLGDAPSEHHAWDWAALAWIDARPLDEQREAARQQVKKMRDEAIVAPKATSHGVFDATKASRADFDQVYALTKLAAQRGFPAEARYTLANNERVTLTLVQLEDVALEMGAQVQALYEAADTIFVQIANAPAEALLDLVDSWPV